MAWLKEYASVIVALVGLAGVIFVPLFSWWVTQDARRRNRAEKEQSQANATVAALKQTEIQERASIREDWIEEVDKLRRRADAADVRMAELMDKFLRQGERLAEQAGKITVLQERLGLMTEERDRLKDRVRELEPLQEQVKHLQAQVKELEHRQQGRRVSDGAMPA